MLRLSQSFANYSNYIGSNLRTFSYICNRFGLKTIIMGKFGATEWILIIAVILLLFGGKKIPELMKGLGSGVKEFKNAAKDDAAAEKKKEEQTNPPV